ncbi:tryptophan--tRNA ligase [bacterium]|nr:tryptophan--tRNA ligase [bacterium]NCQ55564.1 tryptophan--tRNA ligase [Candidatus Parcubacteria bacterium]NCS67389.1 tryptophan--tRNA ligase [Candidatus Peregrinibacteria bacterium]NCS96115.1 tryptophan--tRNA ligase [bacterium]
MTRILTGMQSSGKSHLGNYFGMMKQAKALQDNPSNECFYFVADLHSFTSKQDPELFKQNQLSGVLDWLALVIDPEKSVFYRQSDIRAHTELLWYLSCLTPFGLMERGHAFKDKTAKGLEANVALFTYPILMAADILLYDAEIVPVGKDQAQHVEMARDLAQKFNHHFGDTFVLPESQIKEEVQTIPGLDGAKMSKSYGNTIEIFADEKTMKKKIMSLKTESVELGQPIDPETCNVMAYHRLFENPNLAKLEADYRSGSIGFGDSKKQLFELVWDYFADARARRESLANNPAEVERILKLGAQKASAIAEAKLQNVRTKFGLSANHLA